MKTKLIAAAVLLITTVIPSSAEATVESFLKVSIPYYDLENGEICLMEQVIYTELGIPQGSMMRGSLAPTSTFKDFPTPHYVNLNIVATTPAMVPTYVSDGITPTGIWEYSMKLDLSALAASNGPSVEGRTASVTAAKLFLLAMAENMARYSSNRFLLRVEFIGVPSQVGLPGTRLYPTTVSPYSAPSPLLAAYRRELLKANCPRL